ncbi:MAG TPA: hypothetical protein EYP49_16405 [Anaerolineae bacterium]|nr:hypothetical protein [Anaerolineae bacterium]
MPRSPIPFHVQHIARPAHIERILGIASDDQSLDAESVRLSLTQDGHFITLDGARRSLDMGGKLRLFEKSNRSTYTLTARGRACRNLALYRREVYCDVMHFLLFATWELGGHQDYWSWSYAKTCEILWRDRPSIRGRKAVFGQLSAEASREFPDLDPVVGTETVYAVTNWLRELSPPFFVLENDKLAASREREWFSVELALLAVSYLYAARGAAIQTPLLLDCDTVELLCPLCLASVDRIVAMIETASRTFPGLDIHTGEWGSSVILRQTVDVLMLT